MRPQILLAIAFLTAAFLLTPAIASAAQDADDEGASMESKGPRDEDPPGPKPGKPGIRKPKREPEAEYHRKFQAGLKGSYLFTRSGSYSGGYGGGGWFIELVPSHNWLEIEISMRFMSAAGAGVYIPIDVLFKKPFHIGDVVQLYMGAGPSVSLHTSSGHTSAHFGVATVFGSYFWVSKHFGFLVEMNYIPVFTSPVTHEFGPQAGFVLGW